MLSICSAICLLFSVQVEALTPHQVLERVEQVSVASATADITYVKIDPVLERREIRTGTLVYRACVGHKDAAITFDTLIIGRRKETRDKRYVFSGRWFVEIDPKQKQFIKRELVSPESAKSLDPFALGNGPVPLPIEQTKESVLKEFDVATVKKPSEGLLSKLDEGVVGIQLTPKSNSEWVTIDLFYDPNTWFPVGVQTLEKDGTIRQSRLENVTLSELTDVQKAQLDIATPDPKEWSIDIQPYSN